MQYILPILLLLIGIAVGGVAVWMLLQEKIHHAFDRGRIESNAELAAGAERLAELGANVARLETLLAEQQKQAQEKLALLDEAKQKLSDAFKALASDALNSSNTAFLQLAKTQLEKFQESARGDLSKRQTAIDELVKPVKESLGNVNAKLQEIEKTRIEAYSGLTEQVKSLSDTHKDLRSETSNLVKALRQPQVRGRWGELQLRRVVELAGMLNHCDFDEQQTTEVEDGQLRPDMLVRLPGNKTIIVDAKAPLSAYIDAAEAMDEEVRAAKLKDHARQVKTHITQLGRKSYYSQFDNTPDFVVLFLPGEVFYSAALEQDPELLEYGINNHVLITTPTSLIALLRTAAYGWQQEALAENAKEISQLGSELHKRLSDVAKHIGDLGKKLGAATDAYNRAIGSLESRVLVTARKFKDLGAAGTNDEIEQLTPADGSSRLLQAPEMLAEDNEA